MTLNIRGKIWKYPGIGGWHFIPIGKSASSRIRTLMKDQTRGFGSIRVKARIGKTGWSTSVFPTKEKTFLLPVKSNVRKNERIETGDLVFVQLTFL